MASAALFHRELDLPAHGESRRVTRREDAGKGQTIVLFDETGPGCLLHWWFTYQFSDPGTLDRAHLLQLRIFYDGEEEPAIDTTVGQFFSILLNKPIYSVDSAAIKVLPKNACNCYLPMPFQKLRIELINTADVPTAIWFMGDWQAYIDSFPLSALRLHMVHRGEYPAEFRGSTLMANLQGHGFIAGLTKGVRVKDTSDAWYHSGGDLWLIDGEGSPKAIRGIGGEDIFNMSFGIWERQTDWVGAPYINKTEGLSTSSVGYEAVMYRFFGPDPVWFDRSIVARFGCNANDIETVIYAYLAQKICEPIISPAKWYLAGPFECSSPGDFEEKEWAENDIGEWPEKAVAGFGQYLAEDSPTEFKMPVLCESEHTWCDFARHFRCGRRGNIGTQPVNVSGYAIGYFHIEKPGPYFLQIGFDDWAKIWVDGRPVGQSVTIMRHESGFAVDQVPCQLDSGDHEVRIKLSNANNFQWRLWAFSFKVVNRHT